MVVPGTFRNQVIPEMEQVKVFAIQTPFHRPETLTGARVTHDQVQVFR